MEGVTYFETPLRRLSILYVEHTRDKWSIYIKYTIVVSFCNETMCEYVAINL